MSAELKTTVRGEEKRRKSQERLFKEAKPSSQNRFRKNSNDRNTNRTPNDKARK